MIKKALLSRFAMSNEGTKGVFIIEGLNCFTMELPYKDNIPNISCIPAEVYEVVWQKSNKFGWCYMIKNVSNRTNILIHSGNYAGDISKGYKTHTHGCILPCLRLGKLAGQEAGLISKPAVTKIEKVFNKQPFILEVKDAYSNIRTS